MSSWSGNPLCPEKGRVEADNQRLYRCGTNRTATGRWYQAQDGPRKRNTGPGFHADPKGSVRHDFKADSDSGAIPIRKRRAKGISPTEHRIKGQSLQYAAGLNTKPVPFSGGRMATSFPLVEYLATTLLPLSAGTLSKLRFSAIMSADGLPL